MQRLFDAARRGIFFCRGWMAAYLQTNLSHTTPATSSFLRETNNLKGQEL